MRKKIIALLLFLILAVSLCACSSGTVGNRVVSGSDIQTFTYAYVYLGDKLIVEGPIMQWRDYSNGDEIQLMIGGKYYLTYYSNVVMVSDPSLGVAYSGQTYQDTLTH